MSNELLKLWIVEEREKISNSPKVTIYPKMHGVIIRRYDRNMPGGPSKCIYQNEGFSTQLFMKRIWFFRFLAAKAQVSTPHNAVELYIYDYPHVNPNEVILKHLKSKLVNAKSKTTQLRLAIAKAKENWREIFPIENEPEYEKTVKKLAEKMALVESIEDEIQQIINQAQATTQQ